MEQPLVSVRIVTYNQERYIAAAIESVLEQETDFRYELLIGEDASTDGTAAIVDFYQQKYPDIIRVFHRRKNVGMKMNGRLLMQECRGKYVAALDGDDYWNYRMKMQRQIDYLEAHENVIATAHNVLCVDKDGHPLEERYIDFPMKKKHEYNKYHAMRFEEIGHLGSIVYRNIKYILSKQQWKTFLNCNLNGDFKLYLTLGMLGKVVYFEDVWSCRRRLFEGDGWTASTFRKNMYYHNFETYIEARRYLMAMFDVKVNISSYLHTIRKNANILALKTPTKENIVVVLKINILYVKFWMESLFNNRGWLMKTGRK